MRRSKEKKTSRRLAMKAESSKKKLDRKERVAAEERMQAWTDLPQEEWIEARKSHAQGGQDA